MSVAPSRVFGIVGENIGTQTTLGRTEATAALKLRELVIIPMLNQPVAA